MAQYQPFYKFPISGSVGFPSPPFSLDGAALVTVGLQTEGMGGTSPSVTVQLQTSVDGLNYLDVGSSAQRTSNGTHIVSIDAKTSPYTATGRILVTQSGTDPHSTITVTVTTFPSS